MNSEHCHAWGTDVRKDTKGQEEQPPGKVAPKSAFLEAKGPEFAGKRG